jgi:RNA polymerase sigma-70 factor (ECF subfamily)
METGGLQLLLETKRVELRRFLVARTGSEADADDLLSELWIRANATPTGPIANPEGYLFRMANNIVLDRLREARRRARREQASVDDRQVVGAGEAIDLVDPAPLAEAKLVQRGEVDRLRAAIERLPEGARRVLRMHKLEELSHGEIAAQLGISKSAVEKHMAVAMTHLRRLMED